MINIPLHIRKLTPYKPGKPISELAREKNLTRIVKLGSNENPLGTSPKALAALRNASDKLNRYVDPQATALVAEIARISGKKTGQVICAHGSDALLAYMVSTFTVEGDEVLTSEGTFIGIYVSTNKFGRKLRQIPLREYAIDLEALANAASDSTRIIYLANPNNPTGTMFSRDQFERFMNRVPDNVLVILDEAYASYVDDNPEYPNGVEYDRDNLIVTRTMSKAYGLAGLRIGYACGPEYLIRELYKVKLPFEPNQAAQIAALAALSDNEFLQKTAEVNRKSLKRMTAKLDQLGISYVPTTANFILMILPDERFAASLFQACLDRGLIIRHVAAFGIPNGVRMNSGSEDETTFALEVLEQAYTEVGRQIEITDTV